MNQISNDEIKREYPRIPKEVPIEIIQLEYPPSTAEGEKATAKNIAESGVCLTVAKPYEPKTVLSLKVGLKGWRKYLKNVAYRLDEVKARAPLTAVAEVVWCNKIGGGEYEVGMKFIDIYEDDQIAFRNYISAILESS